MDRTHMVRPVCTDNNMSYIISKRSLLLLKSLVVHNIIEDLVLTYDENKQHSYIYFLAGLSALLPSIPCARPA
jgi:hypothetical protein